MKVFAQRVGNGAQRSQAQWLGICFRIVGFFSIVVIMFGISIMVSLLGLGSADLRKDVEQLQLLVRRVEVEQRDDEFAILDSE